MPDGTPTASSRGATSNGSIELAGAGTRAMKVYAGVTTREEVERCIALGASAIITNPEGMARYSEPPDVARMVADLRSFTDLPLWIQVPSGPVSAIVARAERIVANHRDVGVKIVADLDGIEAIARLRRDGIPCLATAVFSLGQAIAAASAGADGICPFVHRSLLEGRDPWRLLRDVRRAYDDGSVVTEIIAASLTTAWQVEEAARCGATAFAFRLPVYSEILQDTATRTLRDVFQEHWKRFPYENAGTIATAAAADVPARENR